MSRASFLCRFLNGGGQFRRCDGELQRLYGESRFHIGSWIKLVMTSILKIKNGRRQIKPSLNNFNQTKNPTWKHLKPPSHSLGKVKTMKVHHTDKENLKRLTGQLRSLRFKHIDLLHLHSREAEISPSSGDLKEWTLQWAKWWSRDGTRYVRLEESC